MSDRRRFLIAITVTLIAWPVVGALTQAESMSFQAFINSVFLMNIYSFVWELLA